MDTNTSETIIVVVFCLCIAAVIITLILTKVMM